MRELSPGRAAKPNVRQTVLDLIDPKTPQYPRERLRVSTWGTATSTEDMVCLPPRMAIAIDVARVTYARCDGLAERLRQRRNEGSACFAERPFKGWIERCRA